MSRVTHIVLHKGFEKQFAKLDRKIKIAFIERKNLLMHEPFHPLLNNHKLGGEWSRCRSINITGDHRAIFVMKNEDQIVFLAISTHHELYGT